MLKSGAFLLAIYIMTLACVPCCVCYNCADDEDTPEVLNTIPNHSEEDDCKTCSPFYSCGDCCYSFFSPVSSHMTITSPYQIQPQITFYLSLLPENLSVEIWQPPKIVS